VKPGADRDLWIAAWTVALVLAGAIALSALSAKAAEPLEAAKGTLVLSPQQATPELGDYVTYDELDRLGSTFAMRPYEIRCPTTDAWAANPLSAFAWGYTTLHWSYAVLDPLLCAAVLDVAGGSGSSPPWARAVGVEVLVHESYHGRRWHGRADEGLVQCQAIRHWTAAMHMLGADEISIELLKGWALASHWRITRLADEYYSRDCDVPNPW
jgi:hypothetical protein